MKPSLPIWTIPLLLALLGIVLLTGRLGLAARVVIAVETIGYCTYLIARSRGSEDAVRPVSNLIALFPGHLLLLLGISSLDAADGLAFAWAVVPPATVLYDLLAWRGTVRTRIRASISAALYAIIWADLFFLLERLIARTREWNETILIAVFGLLGGVFVGLGVYRHRLVAKE